MFELSVNLARILEVLATQLPETFLRGSSISLTRLVEVRCSSAAISMNVIAQIAVAYANAARSADPCHIQGSAMCASF